MLQLTDIATIRQIEQTADQTGYSYAEMMQVAGRSIAEHAQTLLKNSNQPRIMFLIGKGNNGGDGLIAASLLATSLPEATIGIYLVGERNDTLLENCNAANISIASAAQDKDRHALKAMASASDLLVDALFGIGIHLPLPHEITSILSIINQVIHERSMGIQQDTSSPLPDLQHMNLSQHLRVLAVDCPSGVDCNTGATDQHTIVADETITFILPKKGLFLHPAASYIGTLTTARINMPEEIVALSTSQDYLMDHESIRKILPPRRSNSHKGTYGSALIVAGSSRYIGAASLAAEAAYRSGTGIVAVATTRDIIQALAGINREATWLPLVDESGDLAETASDQIISQIPRYDAMLIGPGIGQAPTTLRMVNSILHQLTHPIPLVIDADGINILANIPNWHQLLPANTVITPHPGEMARLTGTNTRHVQENRWELARTKAKEWNTIIVLKGAQTVVASPDSDIYVAPFQTDALATAGTGDILAGMITGLLAQGIAPQQAAILGVYIHGLAGILAARSKNTRSIIASDLFQTLPDAFNLLEC